MTAVVLTPHNVGITQTKDPTNWIQIQQDFATSTTLKGFLHTVYTENPVMFGGLIAGLSQAATKVGYETLLVNWYGLDRLGLVSDIVKEEVISTFKRNGMPDAAIGLFIGSEESE